MRTRVVPTASGKYAIQVVSKRYGRLTVHKHIGTFGSPEEKLQLLGKAQSFIAETTGQTSLLDLLSTFLYFESNIKTNLSIKRVLKIAGKVLTHKVTNTKTGEVAYVETTIENLTLKKQIDFLKSLGH